MTPRNSSIAFVAALWYFAMQFVLIDRRLRGVAGIGSSLTIITVAIAVVYVTRERIKEIEKTLPRVRRPMVATAKVPFAERAAGSGGYR